MNQTSTSQNSSISTKFSIGFGIIGLILIGLIIFFCCRNRDQNRRSRSSSIESFQQLYFSTTPYNKIENINQRIIERWSAVDQSSLTFYRVYIQDKPDEFYQPVTEERLRSSIEQSKALEYVGHEIVFF